MKVKNKLLRKSQFARDASAGAASICAVDCEIIRIRVEGFEMFRVNSARPRYCLETRYLLSRRLRSLLPHSCIVNQDEILKKAINYVRAYVILTTT